MVAGAVKEFGRLDYAANIAGVSQTSSIKILSLQLPIISVCPTSLQVIDFPKPPAEQTVEEFDRVQSVNTRGLFLCMREELKAMLKNELVALLPGRPATRGAIVNMGSVGGQKVIPEMTSYVASKAAVNGLTKVAGAFTTRTIFGKLLFGFESWSTVAMKHTLMDRRASE